MSKGWFYLLRIGISGGVGMTTYLLFQLLLALLVVQGVLPEDRVVLLQIMAGGLSALLGGFLAMGITKWIPAAGLTGICIAVATAFLGFVIYDGILLNAETLLRIGAMLLGGLLPVLLLGKRGHKRAGKRGGVRVRRM